MTPLIKVKVLLNDSLEVNGIYDSGSNVSLINSKLLKIHKNSLSSTKNSNLKTTNEVKKTDGLTNLKIKIFGIEDMMNVFIINSENFNYDFLIGLDCIKKFKLCQNEKLIIEQKNDQTNDDIKKYQKIKKNRLK